jgi:hypothetical protein
MNLFKAKGFISRPSKPAVARTRVNDGDRSTQDSSIANQQQIGDTYHAPITASVVGGHSNTYNIISNYSKLLYNNLIVHPLVNCVPRRTYNSRCRYGHP